MECTHSVLTFETLGPRDEKEHHMTRFRLKTIVAVIISILLAMAILLKPADLGGPYDAYFSGINSTLKANGIGRPCIVLDLDRLDHNISRVMAHIKPPLHYRVTAKSLPSIELLKYVMKKTGTTRIMGFHQPFLKMLIEELGDVDILLGKPLLISSVNEFYNSMPQAQWGDVSQRIQWLVDSEPRLNRTLLFAREKDLTLRINIEIDVGLRRGGVLTTQELGRLLNIIASNPAHLRFTGLMGYEAHVPHAPPILSSPSKAFKQAMDTYIAHCDYGKENYPGLFKGDLTLNSGGSTTYSLFTGDLPINDIAAGSCMVKPSTFTGLKDHLPALYIAAPVIKKRGGPQIPFLDYADSLIAWWDPNMAETIYLYGGGWAAEIVSPPGVKDNPITSGPLNQNLLPNQSNYNASSKTPMDVGDFLFFQ